MFEIINVVTGCQPFIRICYNFTIRTEFEPIKKSMLDNLLLDVRNYLNTFFFL